MFGLWSCALPLLELTHGRHTRPSRLDYVMERELPHVSTLPFFFSLNGGCFMMSLHSGNLLQEGHAVWGLW
jgi:hypothetical protein